MKVAGSGGCVTTETTRFVLQRESQRRATRQGRDPGGERSLPSISRTRPGGDPTPSRSRNGTPRHGRGGCQARDCGGRGEEGVSDARPGSAGRRSRGRQGRVIMRVFLCCGLMSIVGRPASVTRTLSFCRNERRGAKRPVGRPAFSSAPLDARSRRQARHHGTGRDTAA